MMRTIILLVLVASMLPASADPVPDACSEKTISSHSNPEHRVTTHADCTVDVVLNDGIICVGAWGATDQYQLGPVSVTNHRCTLPGGDPIPPIVVDPLPVAQAGPCGQTHIDGPVSVALRTDCSVLVSIRLYECVWGGHWHQHTPPPVEVREYRCGGPGGVA